MAIDLRRFHEPDAGFAIRSLVFVGAPLLVGILLALLTDVAGAIFLSNMVQVVTVIYCLMAFSILIARRRQERRRQTQFTK